MREIKFRIWDINNKTFISTDIFNKTKTAKYCGIIGTYWNWELYLQSDNIKKEETVIWNQYTGLKDKNWKEIYEGDIFKKDNTIWDIRWNKDSMCYNMYYSYMWDNFIDFLINFEIIWNIYENPNLLNND